MIQDIRINFIENWGEIYFIGSKTECQKSQRTTKKHENRNKKFTTFG